MAFISETSGSKLVANYTKGSGNALRSAYLDGAGILDLLQTSGAAGIGVYLASDADGNLTLIAVPETADRTRISNSNGVYECDIRCPNECSPNPL
ncbi:MAG: hypothetical protein RL757_3113 [Bacteroidota bacterium]|jgi:type 1 fimbria pilin